MRESVKVIVQCPSCGQKNSLSNQSGSGVYKCGKCGATIRNSFGTAISNNEKPKNDDIISYFIKCVEAERAESFSLPHNDRSIYKTTCPIEEIETVLNGEKPYFSIDEDPKLKNFISYRNNYKKNDKTYLATHLIPKNDKSGYSFLPIFITEVLVEDIKNEACHDENIKSEIRISTVDREPAFNHSLLDKSMTIHDRFLLMDEIAEESDWYEKKQLFINNIQKSLSKSIIIQPIIFLSSNLYIDQSAISLELNWINQKFLGEIKKTALYSIFDRVKKEPPKYKKQKYIEIFQLNKVQRDVVQFALNNSLTVITGPPGTGKSQVVLNLLANMYLNQKTVLFASKNNKAVNTVIEKMESIQSSICPFIRLGNKNEKKHGLNKILSGLNEPTITNDRHIYYEEIEKGFHSIEQIQKKHQGLDEYFSQYCAAIQSISSKIKQLPAHLLDNLYDAALKNYEHCQIKCKKFIDKLEVYSEEFIENKKKFIDLRNYLKKKSLELYYLRVHLKELYMGASINFQSINMGEKALEEVSNFIDKMKKQQVINEGVQNKIAVTEKVLKEQKLAQEELKIQLDSFIKTNLNHELVSLVDDNFENIPEIFNDDFYELGQVHEDLYSRTKELANSHLQLNIGLNSFKINSLSGSLLLLLNVLESSSLSVFEDNNLVENLRKFIRNVDSQQSANEMDIVKLNEKQALLENLESRKQEIQSALDTFHKTNFDEKLVSLVDDNFENIPEILNDDFYKLGQVHKELHSHTKMLVNNLLQLKNGLKSCEINPLSENLLLLLYGLESAPISLFENNILFENLTKFINKVDTQRSANEIKNVELNEKQTLLENLETKKQELQSTIDTSISFDKDLMPILLNEIHSEFNNLGYFELYEIKADIEKYISIEKNFFARCLFKIFHPFFKKNCFRRFKAFLTGQPDFLTKYCLSKTSTLNLLSLLDLINCLSQIPKSTEILKNLKSHDDKIKTTIEKLDELQIDLNMENFQWIEEGAKNFSKTIGYDLSKTIERGSNFKEDGIEIPKKLVDAIRHTFEVQYEAYNRFQHFIPKQPDFIADYCQSKISNMGLKSFCELLKHLSQLPKYTEILKKVEIHGNKIRKVREDRDDLRIRLKLENFQWIEEGAKNFSKTIGYNLSKTIERGSNFKEDGIEIPKKLIDAIRNTFEIKYESYNRFKHFISKQPDFIADYCQPKIPNMDLESLCVLLKNLSQMPKYVEYLINLQFQNDEIVNTQKKQNDLHDRLELKNFHWMEDGIKKYAISIQYDLVGKKFENHFDFTDYWIDMGNNIAQLMNHILIHHRLSSQIQKIISEIKNLIPKTKIEHYNFFFEAVDDYFNKHKIYPETESIPPHQSRTFPLYFDLLNDSKAILNILQEIHKIDKEIKKLQYHIESSLGTSEIESDVSEKQNSIIKKSIAIFNDQLSKNIAVDKAKFRQLIIDYFDNWKDKILNGLFESLKKYMGIFVTTNLSTRFNIPNIPALFDFVIIDEASQNDIASVLPLLFRAKHAIIIGDPEQLKHITHLKNFQVEKIANSNNLGGSLIDYHYNKRSAFDLAAKAFQEIHGKSSFVLKNHYRSHDDIIQFSNYEFYESKLFPKKYIRKDISPLTNGVSWKNVKGNYNDHTNFNEANAIIHFLSSLIKGSLNKNISIGIITPFLNQKNLLVRLLFRNQLIDGKPNGQIQASTVHSFQGDERDIIIYSPVLSKGIGKKTLEWLDRSTDLLNVAITRARNALVVIGDQDYCRQTEGIHKRLLNYCIAIERPENNYPNFESSIERKFYDVIKSVGIDFQYQVPIGRYRADFILKQENNFLCVEIDGKQHNQNKSYDYSRDRYFEEIGYKVLRLPSQYVENNCSEIAESLKKVTTQNPKTFYEANFSQSHT